MLVNTYKEFALNQTVMVKKQFMHDFILSSFDANTGFVGPVIDYAFHTKNLLTIAEIDFDSNLLLPATFSFKECEGMLFYGQFIKSSPSFYLFTSSYFKG